MRSPDCEAVRLLRPGSRRVTIVLRASVPGGSVTNEFQWWFDDGSHWTMVRDRGRANTYMWTPLLARANYYWAVYSRAIGSAVTPYGLVASMPFVVTLSLAGRAPSDADGTNTTGIIWRDGTTGWNTLWMMDGLNSPVVGSIVTVGDRDWQIRTVADSIASCRRKAQHGRSPA